MLGGLVVRYWCYGGCKVYQTRVDSDDDRELNLERRPSGISERYVLQGRGRGEGK